MKHYYIDIYPRRRANGVIMRIQAKKEATTGPASFFGWKNFSFVEEANIGIFAEIREGKLILISRHEPTSKFEIKRP